MNDFTALLPDIWRAPDGDYYLGENNSGNPPQYLINLSVLLKWFAEEGDSIDLLIAAQRLIIAYVQEKDTDKDMATPVSVITNSVNEVAFFADVLEEAICRDAMFIDGYMHRGTDSNWSYGK